MLSAFVPRVFACRAVCVSGSYVSLLSCRPSASPSTPLSRTPYAGLQVFSGIARGFASKTGAKTGARKTTSSRKLKPSKVKKPSVAAAKKLKSASAKSAKSLAAARRAQLLAAKLARRRLDIARRAAAQKQAIARRKFQAAANRLRQRERRNNQKQVDKAKKLQQRARTIAKRRNMQQREKMIKAKRAAAAVVRRKTRAARIRSLAESRFARAKKFLAAHPVIARRRAYPNQPTPPASLWARYVKKRYASVAAALKESKETAAAAVGPAQKPAKVMSPEVIKLLAAEWKAIPEAEKTQAAQEYQKERAAYEQKRAEFNKTLPPKRPSGPYIKYFTDNHGRIARENPKLKASEIASLVGSQWKTVSATEKAAQQEKYNAEVASWKMALDAWKKANPAMVAAAAVARPSITKIQKEVKQAVEKAEKTIAKTKKRTATTIKKKGGKKQ